MGLGTILPLVLLVLLVIVLLLLALIGQAFAVGQIQWAVVGQFLTAEVIIVGFGWTLLISACALAFGVALFQLSLVATLYGQFTRG